MKDEIRNFYWKYNSSDCFFPFKCKLSKIISNTSLRINLFSITYHSSSTNQHRNKAKVFRTGADVFRMDPPVNVLSIDRIFILR